MLSTLESVFSGEHGSTTYMALTWLLAFLIFFALWRGRNATREGTFVPLSVSILAYILGHGLVASKDASILNLSLLRLFVFSALQFVSFFCVALLVTRVLTTTDDSTGGASPSRPESPNIPSAVRLLQQSGYMAVLGALVYLVLFPAGPAPFSLKGLINMIFLAATARVAWFVLWHMSRVSFELRTFLFICFPPLVASWLLLDASPLFSDVTAAGLVKVAKIIDIGALVVIVAGIQANYVGLGAYYKDRADESRKEMETAKAELTKLSKFATDIYEDSSDLIRRQKEQTLVFMKRVESLEKILQIGMSIQRRKDLQDLLQMIVELVSDNLGFKTVTLRLLNTKTQSFETKAFVGLSEEVKDTVVNYRIPMFEFQKMIEPRFKISKSYFLKNNSPWYGDDLKNDESIMVRDTWGDIDMLVIPLLEDDGRTIGYLSVENPENTKLSVGDVIENLEHVASLAVIAIRNARFFQELEEKNQKLRTYTDKLSSLNKLKSNFVATISHEFRTPLTSITAYCETLLSNADEVDRNLLKEFLVVINEESSRLMTLIEDILDFSQMESGAIKFERTPCNLTDIINSSAKELEKNFKRKELKLHQELPAGEVMVRAEKELMKQLFINLLHNASKFCKEGGNVWVKLEDETGAARVVVEDEGIGIPEDEMDKIFDQFHQADSSSTRKYGGSGLGLAICKNIVDWHDGRIWVENVPGVGARFVVVIPKKQVVVRSHVFNVSNTVRRFEVERFLELMIENLVELMNVRKASLMLMDGDRKDLRIETALGLDEEIVENAAVQIGEGIAGKVAQQGETLLVKDIEKDERIARSNNEPLYGSKSFLSVPIKRDDEVIGVVNVASPVSKLEFDDEDGQILELFARRLSFAIKQLEEYAIASVNYEKVRNTLKAIVDTKRYIDVQNTDIIMYLVIETARLLGLDARKRINLQYALNLYDLGLSKVGYHIIKKPKELTLKDREEIDRHPLTGMEMLEAVGESAEITNLVLHHHENYDGTGYPAKIKGDAIPIEARILRVADSFRALTSRRSYQKQYSFREAKEVLRHRSGSFFDPKVVDAFIEAMETFENRSKTKVKSRGKSAEETVTEHS